jgi:hypothetical protein
MSSARTATWFELFMASIYGRALRVIFGITLIIGSLVLVGGATGWIIAVFGLVPIAAGVFGLCPIAPLWGGHFIGSRYCARK